MVKGKIAFTAQFLDNRLTIPMIELASSVPGVDRVELESGDGTALAVTVYFKAVQSVPDAEAIATEIVETMIERISFSHAVALGDARRTVREFAPLQAQPYTLVAEPGEFSMVGESVVLGIGLGAASAAALKVQLEASSLPGERIFGPYRAALQSRSPVERFLQLYHILLMLRHDDQQKIDAFIQREEPGVPMTPQPHRPHIKETVYTRLRNEFAHERPGVNIQQTKVEMAAQVGKLLVLAKRAIEIYG